MAKYQCKSCLGTYEDQDGGYYHVCPEKTVNPRNENRNSKGAVISEGKGRTKIGV